MLERRTKTAEHRADGVDVRLSQPDRPDLVRGDDARALGEPDAGPAVFRAIETVLKSPSPPLTPDLGGKASTEELGGAIQQALWAGH